MITRNQKPSLHSAVAIGVICTLVAVALLPTVTEAAPSALPPRPTPQPTPQPTSPLPPRPEPQPSPAPPSDGGKVSFIELHVLTTPERQLTANQWQALWTIVQWQDGLDDWQDVEGWQGTLDEVSDNVGKKVWWVAEASFGKGPFRWVIYQQQAGTWLATSEPFYLPTVGGETVKVEVVLVPPVAAVKSPPTAEAPGAYVSAPGNATAGTERRHGGNWAANRYTAHTAGNWTIRGSFKGHTADVVLTVNIGELSEIVISPDTATVTAGNAQAYTAQAFDAYGNLLGDVTANTNFSVVEEGHGGSWAANRYLAHTAGTWTVRGTYRGLTNDAKLNVKPGELSYIVITPKTAVVNAGNEIAFTAEAFDAYDNSLGDVSDDTTFTIVESKYGD